MATFYYVTAIAPATLLVNGRRMQLLSGDSRGPFSEAELAQIMSGPDRRRLVANSHTASEQNPPPTVTPTSVNGLGVVVDAPTEAQQQEVPVAPTSFEESTPPPTNDSVEPVVVIPTDVNEPMTDSDKSAVEESITEVLPESKESLGPSHTSSSTKVYDDKPPEDTVEEEDTSEEVKTTRSRRRKAS